MARIISIHEYDLNREATQLSSSRRFEARGLFDLPGLMTHHFIKGVKGARQGAYAAGSHPEQPSGRNQVYGV